MNHDEFPSLEEWIASNTSLGISEQASIRSYTEYLVENFDKSETIELVSTMIISMREMFSDAEKLDILHKQLLLHFQKLKEELDWLQRNLKS